MVKDKYQCVNRFDAPGSHLCGLGWDGLHLWHSDGETNEIYQLDPRTGEVKSRIRIDNVRTDLAVDEEELWQVGGDLKQIYILDKNVGSIKYKKSFEENAENACAIHLEENYYLIGYKDTGKIEKRNRFTDKMIMELSGNPEIGGIGLLNEILWFSTYNPGKIVGISCENNEFTIDGNPTGLCTDDEKIWYADFTHRKIIAIVPE